MLVDNVPYLTVGVMQDKMQMGTYQGPDDDHGVIPISTFRAQYGRERLTTFVIQVADPTLMKSTLFEMRKILPRVTPDGLAPTAAAGSSLCSCQIHARPRR